MAWDCAARGRLAAVTIVAATLSCNNPADDRDAGFVIRDPYAVAGEWYKANLHMHSSHSDGTFAAGPLVQLYKDAGYALLAITDHNQYGDQDGGIVEQLQTDELHDWNGDGFTYANLVMGSGVEAYVRDWTRPRSSWMTDDWFRPPAVPIAEMPIVLPGFEASYSYFGAHFGVLGHLPGPVQAPRPGFSWLDDVDRAAGFAFIAHPGPAHDTAADTSSDLERLASTLPLARFRGVEIVNGARLTRAERAYATGLWDALWAAGYEIWGLANDDSHTRPGVDTAFPFVAYNMVRCDDPTERGFLDALRTGAFYASTGLQFVEFHVEGSQIEVFVPGAERIAFIGSRGVLLHEALAERATYRVLGSEGYVRVEAVGDEVRAPLNTWRRAVWSQPIRILTKPD